MKDKRKPAEELPPHSVEAEDAALGCVLLSAFSGSQAVADALLLQLRPQHFYQERCKVLHALLTRMRMEQRPIDLVTLAQFVKGSELRAHRDWIFGLPDQTPSAANFSAYLTTLKQEGQRRVTLSVGARLQSLAANETVDADRLTELLGELTERSRNANGTENVRIPILTWDQIEAFTPDPKSFLIGDNIISYGDVFCMAGWQGLGKSRILNTLAFAGAKGAGKWMGYDVRRKFKTLVLITQTEGKISRLKQEIEGLPKSYAASIKFSICEFNFAHPEFRAELQRIYEQWPFDCLIVDHWSDVSLDDGKADYQEAFNSVMQSLPKADLRPAVGFAVHMRKMRGGENWQPKLGRALLSEIMGASYISQKARTVFAIQAVTMDMEDDRIVFEVAKCNDGEPHGRSAWYRRNGAFLPCEMTEQDWDGWMNPVNAGAQKSITAAVLETLFESGRRKMTRAIAVKEMKDLKFSQASAYKALRLDGPFAENLSEVDELIAWRKP